MRPESFAYFVQGAPAQIFDNGNGIVAFGVANGTGCKMVSLAWNSLDIETEQRHLIAS
jgi:hypothetical protein